MGTYDFLQIPHNDNSIYAIVPKVKAFRLLSLQLSPESFGSTYARELQFTDEAWYGRLANPKAATFIAQKSGEICSSIVLIGPLAYAPDARPPVGNPWIQLNGYNNNTQKEAHFRINGTYTLPQARGNGLARKLIEMAFEYGAQQASLAGKEFVCTIIVNQDNIPAKLLYETCGFVAFGEEIEDQEKVLLLKYQTRV